MNIYADVHDAAVTAGVLASTAVCFLFGAWYISRKL